MEKFVDLEEMDPSILLDIRYATTNNFTHVAIYPEPKCFLRESVAMKLLAMQKKLKKEGLSLKVFDGYRPWDVTNFFWSVCPDVRYCANPAIGSKHNRGAAVDATLVDLKTGKELPMPTEFDSFSEKSHRDYMDLPKDLIANRIKLETIFVTYGFVPLPTEWWHFDDQNWEKHPIENLSFQQIMASL